MHELTCQCPEPLGLLVPDNEKIVGGNPRQRDGKADACAEGVGVEGKGDHEEAGEREQGRDEERHLESKEEVHQTLHQTPEKLRVVTEGETEMGCGWGHLPSALSLIEKYLEWAETRD